MPSGGADAGAAINHDNDGDNDDVYNNYDDDDYVDTDYDNHNNSDVKDGMMMKMIM